MFGRTTTRTVSVVADEPMVTLDAIALTQRIGTISRPEVRPQPVYHALTSRPEPAQPKWRSYLRPRVVS